MKTDIPAFKFVEGEKTIASFDAYDKLYMYCQDNEKLKSVAVSHPDIIMLFGEVPLKYDVSTHRLYSLGWREVGKPQTISGDSAGEKQER